MSARWEEGGGRRATSSRPLPCAVAGTRGQKLLGCATWTPPLRTFTLLKQPWLAAGSANRRKTTSGGAGTTPATVTDAKQPLWEEAPLQSGETACASKMSSAMATACLGGRESGEEQGVWSGRGGGELGESTAGAAAAAAASWATRRRRRPELEFTGEGAECGKAEEPEESWRTVGRVNNGKTSEHSGNASSGAPAAAALAAARRRRGSCECDGISNQEVHPGVPHFDLMLPARSAGPLPARPLWEHAPSSHRTNKCRQQQQEP